MRNRDSQFPGRVKLTPVDAANGIYDLTRADQPKDEGTPLNKALLDYAVAACGVTAGTATALTLDDAFGGFTLVDGAKVNFRLHVTSGVNPTLNVNGTGAKNIVDVYDRPLPAGLNVGTWVQAVYSGTRDVYMIAPYSMGSVTMIEGDTFSVSIALPDGFKAFRVNARIRSGMPGADLLTLSTNTALSWKISGVKIGTDLSLSGVSRSPSGASVELPINFYQQFAALDLVIIRNGAHNGVSGAFETSQGRVAFTTNDNAVPLNQISLSCSTMGAGSIFIVEEIA